MTQEAITKYGGENIELSCRDISFDVEYDSNSKQLTISNTGENNIPIYGIKLKIFKDKSEDIKNIENGKKGWPERGLNPGQKARIDVGSFVEGTNVKKIGVIPILLGNSEKEHKKYACEDQIHEKEV